MSTTLGEVVRHVQNPALGAILQWRFVTGYVARTNDASGPPLVLLFLVLPLLYHHESYRHISSTQLRSGLRTFAAKFAAHRNGDTDLLYAVHDQAAELRDLSLESIQIARTARLLDVDALSGIVHPLSTSPPSGGIPQLIRAMNRSAEKLGAWCADLSLHEISAILRVRF